MNKERSNTPSKIPKGSGIPRPRSKSGDRMRANSRPTDTTGKRPRSRPGQEISEMSEPEDTVSREVRPRSAQEEAEGKTQFIDYNNLPKNIPRYHNSNTPGSGYTAISSPRYKSNVLPKPELGYSSFRNSALKQEFGYLSSPREVEDVQNPSANLDDIASMFQRPIPSIPSVQHPVSSTTPLQSYATWSTNDSVTSKSLISGSPSVKSSYSTQNELNGILAKYQSIAGVPPVPVQREYQVYQVGVKTNYQHYSSHEPEANFGSGYHKEIQVSKSKILSDQQQAAELSATAKDNLGVFGLPLDKHAKKAEERHKGRHGKHHTSHFRQTPDGELIINPEQIAFQSKNVTVIVSDPGKMWNLKYEKTRDHRNQEQLTQEVEAVINRGLNRYFDTSHFEPSEEDHPRRSVEKDYINKEIVTMKYSEAKIGTDQFMADIHHRIRSGRHADTHVIIDEKVFPCHSVALESVSEYFDNSMRDKETLRRIKLPESDVPSEVFPTLMDWILQDDHGRSSVINKGNVVALFSCAKFLGISELKSQCVVYLQEKVETNDRYLMSLWDEVKKRPNCQELMVVISAKAAISFQYIYKEKKFLNLDVEELVLLLSSDDIVIESEFDVFETAVQWMLYDWDTRKVHTNEVMNTVRLGLLTPLQLTQISHSPELTKGASYPREYTELLAYGSVKSMIDDGLAFSIVHESYKNQPDEIKKWVESTGIKAPRPRGHAIPSSRSKSLVFGRNGNLLTVPGSTVERQGSYTVVMKPVSGVDSHSDSQEDAPVAPPATYRGRNSVLESLADNLGSLIKDEDIKNVGKTGFGGGGHHSRSSSRDGNYRHH